MMATPQPDIRSSERRACDERLAAESARAPLGLPTDAPTAPMEEHLGRLRRAMAVPGVVENGLVRPLDPTVRLREKARVIIVASEQ